MDINGWTSTEGYQWAGIRFSLDISRCSLKNQGCIFWKIWPEVGRRGSDRAETRGKRSHKAQEVFN